VIVLSHGAGGDWDTHYAQARHLASHGYIVLCLEHVGSNRERMTQGLRLLKNLEEMTHDSAKVFNRPKDVTFVLDRAEEWNRSHRDLSGKFDLSRVGAMGHSFGAFTTMVVCGMRPVLDWLTPSVQPGKGIGPDQRDKRIHCGVALSPQGVGEPFFLRESFRSLKVPLLGVSGTLDKQQNGMPADNRKEAFALWPPNEHRFVWLHNAKHLDFTDSTGSERRAIPSATRDDVQPVTRAATLLFFEAHLKGDAEAAKRLTKEGLQPYLRGKIDTADVLFR
jgi:predicted dienelactone hydrolase